MKVCYIATTTHLSSALSEGIGSTTHTYHLARELREQGNDLVVVSERWDSYKGVEELNGLRVYRLFRGGVVSAKKIKQSPVAWLGLVLKPLSNLWLAWRVSRIAEKEGCDVLLERAQSVIGGLVSWSTGKPLVMEVIDNLFSRASLARAKRVFAYTDRFFDEDTRKKVELVSAGVDLAVFRPRKTRICYDACYVGSFKEWDGLEDLMEAIDLARKQKPSLVVALVGDGPRREAIQALIKEKGLEKNVAWLGRKGLEETAETISASCLGLAPYNVSRSRKGEFKKHGYYFSPLKVLEYMACGKAVVATDYALVAGLLPKGNALAGEGDAAALAEGLLGLLASDDRYAVEQRNLLAVRRFSWKRLAEKINDALEAARE